MDLRINIYRGQVDTNNAIINANDTKNGANGVNCGADDGTNGAEVPLNKEQTQIEKLLQIIENNLMCLRYREESVCNTGILCGKNGYIEKNGFSNVRFFTGKR